MAVFQDPSWRIKKKPCEYYRKGRCIFGQDRCNFLHVMNDWNPDESTIIESQSLSKGLAVNIFPETPPSVRSPPRSPRTTSLLLALKGVIKDEEDEYIDDMSYEAVDDETGVDTQPVNPHSAPPSPAHSVLLSPVEFSDLQLKHFSLLHSGTRDSQQVPFQNSGFYDYGTPPSQWASPSPMNLSPPRSPALSSTFDLLASPFGSPLTRLLPNHAVKSPQIGPFVPRIPVSPSPLSSQCDPSQDEIQPDMDLDSPSEYHRQKLKERAEMVEAEAEVHTATLIAPRIPSDDEDDEDDGEYTGRLTARWDSDDQVTVRPFVLAPAPSPRSKSKVHRDDKLALVREEVDEALRKQSESSSKIFHSPETAQPHPSFNPEDIQADSTAHTPIPSSLGEDVTAQLAYLTQSQSDEFDDEDAVTSPEEDDTIGSLYNAYSDIGSDSERDEEDHYLEETDADGDICVSMSLPIVGSLPGTVKSLPLASLSEDRRVFTPPPRKSMSQSLSMSLPRAPSFPGTVTNLASASLPEDPRVLAPSPRRSTSQSLSMSLPRAPSLTGTVTDSAPASLPEDRRVFTPPPRKSTSQSLSMSLPRAPSLPGTAIDLASASLPEDRRVFTLSPRRSTSQSLSMSLPRAPLLGTVTDSASASSPENPRVFAPSPRRSTSQSLSMSLPRAPLLETAIDSALAEDSRAFAPSPRRSTSQSLSMSLPRAPLLETAIDSALAEDSRAFAPSPRRSTSQSLSMSLPRAPSFPETITDSAPALLLEDPRVSVLSPGRFTSLPRAHSLPGTVTDSAPAFLPEDPRVFTPPPERLTSQLVAKVFKPPAEESTPISSSNDINDAGDQSVLRSPYRRKNILRPLTLSMIMTANPLISASSTHADSTISSAPKSPFQSNDHPSSITPINVTSVSATSDFAASRHSLLSSLLSPPLDSDHAQKATIIPSLSPLSAPPAVTSGEPSGKSSPVRTTTTSTIPQPFKRSSIYYIREEATDMPNDTGLSQEPRSAPLAPQTWRGNESKKSSSEKSAGTSVSQRSLSRGSAAISRRSSSAASLSVPQSAHTTSSEIHVRRDLSPSPAKETCPSPHASTPRPALLFAIASDNPEEVERVLECGSNDKAASITANDAIGPQAQSALEFTLENDALKNRLGIVKQLLEFGADPSKAALTQSKPNSESDLDAALK
ncbi:hypothetical protein D9757_002820 [Collybiopsis confluens]|uniref:C3H1-type domain-containing protein n=1 Tax=Collybiopsis confluens TaxID=2823264 RepID=A0A8H5MDP3_9AGAR|nr:hypothetical protein D9757_002820 [Collybiopsis confluens]